MTMQPVFPVDRTRTFQVPLAHAGKSARARAQGPRNTHPHAPHAQKRPRCGANFFFAVVLQVFGHMYKYLNLNLGQDKYTK
jgi:hypothetical protein